MDTIAILVRALDQAGDVLDHVHTEALERPTPCEEWDVGRLADHLVQTPRVLLAMMDGEARDWSSPPPHLTQGWGPAFRVAADDLVHAWHQREHDGAGGAAWQCAELAVHTWDLAIALGLPTADLDPEVAELGLSFMRESLTTDNRGGAFGPERPAQDDAGPYERIAAFSGRAV